MATITLDRIALAEATIDRIWDRSSELSADLWADERDMIAAARLEEIATLGYATHDELDWLDEMELINDAD